MNRDLGWRADGIERALAVGGVPLEVYRRPGFIGGQAVRRAQPGGTETPGPQIDPLPERDFMDEED